MKCRVQFAVIGICLVLSGFASAQISIGEDTQLSGNANITFGYGGSVGDGSSSHNTSIGGNADFNGYYYVPTFISFSIQPYLNRSQDNSNFASISNSNGLISSVNFFTGTRFPGSFSYIRQGSSTETIGVGNGGYKGDGSGQSWNLGWGVRLPDLPTLSVSFANANERSSVYGIDGDYRSRSKTLTLTSTYTLAGFGLTGQTTKSALNFESPGFLSDSSDASANYSSISLSANRRLPWHGNLQMRAMRYRNGSDTLSMDSQNTSRSISASVSMIPVRRVAFNVGANFQDNLNGVLNQYFIDQGSAPVFEHDSSSSRSFGAFAGCSVEVFRRFSIGANVNQSVQYWLGRTRSQEQFSGTANYNFDKGFMKAVRVSGGIVDSATEQGNQALGAIAIVDFDRRFGMWSVRANYSYSHSIQTLVGIINDSSMSYGSTVTRKVGRNILQTSYYGSHTGVQASGGSNRSDNFSGSYGARTLNVSGNWGRSSGYSLLTSNGLFAGTGNLPPEALTPESVVVFNGSFYGAGGTWIPTSKIEFTGNYTNSSNTTLAGDKSTFGSTRVIRTRARYRMRQLNFDAGATHLRQTISAPGSRPVAFTSYYFGVSRWFNLF